MFKVPGWNVPDSALKSQVESKASKRKDKSADVTSGKSSKKSKKRKRDKDDVQVTPENASELYNKLVQGKADTFSTVELPVGNNVFAKQPKKKKKKHQKHQTEGKLAQGASDDVEEIFNGFETSSPPPNSLIEKSGEPSSGSHVHDSTHENVRQVDDTKAIPQGTSAVNDEGAMKADISNQPTTEHNASELDATTGKVSSSKRKKDAHKQLHHQKESERLAKKPPSGQSSHPNQALGNENGAPRHIVGTRQENTHAPVDEGQTSIADTHRARKEAKRFRQVAKKARKKASRRERLLAKTKDESATKDQISSPNEANSSVSTGEDLSVMVEQGAQKPIAQQSKGVDVEKIVASHAAPANVEEHPPAKPNLSKSDGPGETMEVSETMDASISTMDHSDPQKKKHRKKKRKHRESEPTSTDQPAAANDEDKKDKPEEELPAADKTSKPTEGASTISHEKQTSEDQKKERKKAKKKKQSSNGTDVQPPNGHINGSTNPSSKTTNTAIPTSQPTTPLTPIQQKMSSKLLSARFRSLNQTLYTTPSSFASTLFTTDPSAFTTYHTGFRAQVATWPTNPIDTFIAQLFHRAKNGVNPHDDIARRLPPGFRFSMEPLPREGKDKEKGKVCRVVDLGCGDANLAAEVRARGAKLGVDVRSFDLARPEGENGKFVEAADITDLAAVGVRAGSVNVAVCCLCLMGTDWVKVVDECARVVGRMGEVWVAEVKSRFRRKGQAAAGGGGKKEGRKGAKGKAEEDEEGWRDELEGKDDGDDDETDTGPFVEVWKKRGFELRGEVEKSNKMFVTMRFVKVVSKPAKGQDQETKTKFGDVETEEDREAAIVEEGKVLKPCLYKTR